MSDPKKQLENLDDAMVEDILSLTDEEMIAEVIEDGEDPTEIADRMRRLFEAALREAEQRKESAA